jgi:hypothetical protein
VTRSRRSWPPGVGLQVADAFGDRYTSRQCDCDLFDEGWAPCHWTAVAWPSCCAQTVATLRVAQPAGLRRQFATQSGAEQHLRARRER